MIEVFFKRAFRSFLNNKMFSVLNVTGIAIGLAVTYFAANFISFEYSYDTSHNKSDNIYRLTRKYRSQDYSIVGFPNWNDTDGTAQKNWIKTIKDAQGVANITHFMIANNKEFLEANGKRIECDAILTTNTPKSFIEIFDWSIINGSLKDFSSGTDKLIINKSSAESLFGKSNSYEAFIGQTLRVLDKDLQLSAIIQDVPENTHFDFSMAISVNKIDYWGSRVYVEVIPGVSLPTLTANIDQQVALYNPRVVSDSLYGGHFLQPIKDIHLKSNILYESKEPGNHTYIFLIGLFAVFTLFIAIFNYSNLTLALKSRQNKTLGVLKTMGAASEHLALQFLGEAVLQAFIAIPIAIAIIYVATPYFKDLMGINFKSNFTGKLNLGLLLTVIASLIGIVASIVPMLFLAGKNTVVLFKNSLKNNNFQGMFIRKYLILTQFVFLIVISAITFFTSQQMKFIHQKDLGFKKDQIVYVYTSESNQNAFQEKLRQIPEITHVGNGSNFGTLPYNQGTYKLEGDETVYDDSNQLYLDYNALKAYEIKTNLSIEGNPGRKTIINRNAAEKLAKSNNISVDQLVGKTIISEPEYTNPENGQVGFPFVIDGIFEDIHLFSLKEKIDPYFITLSDGVRMDGRTIISYNSPKAIEKIKNAFKELNEIIPFEITYLEDNINQLYLQEERLNTLLKYFSFIAILLGALGIIGVTIFLTNIKIKEIGIRKILGATPISVASMSIKEYIPMVLIALCISFPIVYFLTSKWLDEFAYKIDIQYINILPITACILFMVSFIVGVIALKAANMNPVNSLRSE